jgi:hypothetical protein
MDATVPSDVLVVATRLGVSGLSMSDGTLRWEHAARTGWPFGGVPLVAQLDNDVVVLCAGRKLVWLRVNDGTVLGSDEVWFPIERIVKNGSKLVVQGTGGIACYLGGVRSWGVVGVQTDPHAILFTDFVAWTTDARGQPLKPAGALACNESAALVLGDSVAQIDRTVASGLG